MSGVHSKIFNGEWMQNRTPRPRRRGYSRGEYVSDVLNECLDAFLADEECDEGKKH